jgi:hypothetical protein
MANLGSVPLEKQLPFECKICPAEKVLKVPEEEDSVRLQGKGIQVFNLIMIAVGSGVTPFLALLERIKNLNLHSKVRVHMFYGVMNDHECFFYHEFMKDFFKKGHEEVGSTLHLACSRGIHEDEQYPGITKYKGRYTAAV